MKQCIMIILVLSATAVHADDFVYKYLVMTASNGTKTSVSVADLNMKFVDGQLVAVNADGTTSFSLSSLASMSFSEEAVNSSGTTTGVNQPHCTQPLQVFTPSGVVKGSFDSLSQMRKALPAGIYIVKQNGKVIKMTIK